MTGKEFYNLGGMNLTYELGQDIFIRVFSEVIDVEGVNGVFSGC
jgi:hypothetical protein